MAKRIEEMMWDCHRFNFGCKRDVFVCNNKEALGYAEMEPSSSFLFLVSAKKADIICPTAI